jgi:MFS family permease
MITDQPPAASPGIAPAKGAFLVNRQFALLLSGQAVANITGNLYTTLLLIWVFVTTSSGAAVSGVLIAGVLPSCVLGPLAGVFIDRWNRRTTMALATAVFALAALPPAFAPAGVRLPAIYASALLLSASSCFFMPAKSGVLQVIVPEHRQGHAAYLSSAMYTAGFVIGPALSAPLFFALGPAASCLVSCALFLLAAGCLLLLRSPQDAPAGKSRPDPAGEGLAQGIRTVWRDLSAGIGFVLQTRVLFILLLVLCIEMFASSFFNALNIVFITRSLHVGAAWLGPINTSIGIGTLIGSVLAGLLVKWIAPKHLFAWGILLLGVGIVAYALQTHYLVALIILGLAVIPQSGIDMGLGPMLIEATPPALIGRAQSVIETAMLCASLLSLALAGVIGQAVPVNLIFIGSGALTALAGVIGWLGLTQKRRTEGATLLEGRGRPG